MPKAQIDRYTCPVTYQVADVTAGSPAPDNWYLLNGEYYFPLSQVIMSKRIMAGFSQNPPVALTPAQVIAPATAAELTAVGLPVPTGVS